jgi:hypothetical protein
MKTAKRVTRAVADVTIRVVVKGSYNSRSNDDAIDYFLERALHSNTDILTEGLIAATHKNTEIIHEWEELEEYEGST